MLAVGKVIIKKEEEVQFRAYKKSKGGGIQVKHAMVAECFDLCPESYFLLLVILMALTQKTQGIARMFIHTSLR